MGVKRCHTGEDVCFVICSTEYMYSKRSLNVIQSTYDMMWLELNINSYQYINTICSFLLQTAIKVKSCVSNKSSILKFKWNQSFFFLFFSFSISRTCPCTIYCSLRETHPRSTLFLFCFLIFLKILIFFQRSTKLCGTLFRSKLYALLEFESGIAIYTAIMDDVIHPTTVEYQTNGVSAIPLYWVGVGIMEVLTRPNPLPPHTFLIAPGNAFFCCILRTRNVGEGRLYQRCELLFKEICIFAS